MRWAWAVLAAVVLVAESAAQEEVELVERRKIATEAYFGVLSSDGKWVLLASKSEKPPATINFSVIDTATGKEAFSTHSQPHNLEPMAGYLRPEVFSPDGARILVPSRADDAIPDKWGGARLLICEAGKDPHSIPATRASAWYGSWSPD